MKTAVPAMIARIFGLILLSQCGSPSTQEVTASSKTSQPEHENFARNRCGGAAKPVEEIPGGLILRRSLPGFASMPLPYGELWSRHRANRNAEGQSHSVSPGARFMIFCQETSSEEAVRVRIGEITNTVLDLIDAHVEVWGLRLNDAVYDVNRCRIIWGNFLDHRPWAVVTHTWDGSKENGSLVCVLFENFNPMSMGRSISR